MCPTFCNPMDCSLPGSSNCEIFQARILEWAAISFSHRKLKMSSKILCLNCCNLWQLTYMVKVFAHVIKLRILRDDHGFLRGAEGIWHRGKEYEDRGRLQWYSHKPRSAGSHQQLEEPNWFPSCVNTDLPHSFDFYSKLIIDFWPPELQKVKFCCFKLSSLWQFVTPAIVNQHD